MWVGHIQQWGVYTGLEKACMVAWRARTLARGRARKWGRHVHQRKDAHKFLEGAQMLVEAIYAKTILFTYHNIDKRKSCSITKAAHWIVRTNLHLDMSCPLLPCLITMVEPYNLALHGFLRSYF